MLTPAQEVNSKARVQILRDFVVWKGFDAYFGSHWQRKEMLRKLGAAAIDPWLVGEWAMWSFHELAKEEAKWKRERGDEFKRAHRLSIESSNQTTNAYSVYASVPASAPGMASVYEAFRPRV